MQTIGERISYLRRLNGLKKKELTDELNITNIGRIEKGERTPGIDTVISISNYFNVTTDWLLTGKEYNEDTNTLDFNGEDMNWLLQINKLNDAEKMKLEGFIEGILFARDNS